ncbi:MAG TPA: 1-phosphofructokinase family hexose kinase, partial [Rhodopila sp.]|nr:1-phosphofructokinase family hexose kinase [Rhodopila sp.]
MTTNIVTLTLNPAVDLACMAPAVRPTHKIRTFNEHSDPGGGGINVARVVHALGGNTLALVLTGGVTGRWCEELLNETGVPWRALPIRGRNRISLNVHDQETGLEYRFVPEGPVIAEEEWSAALDLLKQIDADWIVASGSLPRGVPIDFYARCAEVAAARRQKFVVDTSGPALQEAVRHGVTLLKLSQGELAYLAGRPLPDALSQRQETEALLRAGSAEVIAVSLGADGAILATPRGFTRLPAIPVQERGAVGAGDSFLAGLVLALTRGLPDDRALGFAMAAGASAVATYGTARVAKEAVETLY